LKLTGKKSEKKKTGIKCAGKGKRGAPKEVV